MDLKLVMRVLLVVVFGLPYYASHQAWAHGYDGEIWGTASFFGIFAGGVYLGVLSERETPLGLAIRKARQLLLPVFRD
jgi:hypothetical protein